MMHDVDWLLRAQNLLLQHRLLQPHLLLLLLLLLVLLLLLLHGNGCCMLPLLQLQLL
jgi:hypothetical protein